MHFGHIFHGIEHAIEGAAIHEGEGIIEHAAVGFIAGIL